MEIPPDLRNLPPEAQLEIYRRVTASLWARGELRYLLEPLTQTKIYDALKAATRRKFFLLCSRRLGKTFILLALAFEVALRKPGARVLYLAPQAKDAAEIATDVVSHLLRDCPEETRRRIEIKAHVKEIHITHPTGEAAVIRLKGVNNETADNLRGGATDLIIFDECGKMDNLDYVVSSVALPMTMTTGGKLVFATTPPVSPGHDSKKIYDDLADTGDAVKFTILDNHRVSDEIKGEFLKEAGEDPAHIPDILAGKRKAETTTALREYFCEFVTDASKAVVPEMLKAEADIVREHPRPPFYDAYTAVDPGFEDKTGVLFGYYDFRAGKIVIEDEALLARASTNDIGRAVLDNEYRLWGDTKVFWRVVDDDPRLAADLYERHGLVFAPAQKRDSLGAINLLRSMISAREIVINPRCAGLIRQLREATWNNKATDFARAGESSPDAHYDLLAALKYLVRAVNRHRNPYPVGWTGRMPTGSEWRSPKKSTPNALYGMQLDLLGDTPIGRRLKSKK